MTASAGFGTDQRMQERAQTRPYRVALAKFRPAKLRSALKRRWFEQRVLRTRLRTMDGLVYLGTSYGGWTLPGDAIDASWTCYMVGAGGDVSAEVELTKRYGATVRSFDAVADYVDRAQTEANGAPRFSAHHAAIALQDGPMLMQVTHDQQSQSVSAAHLYDSHSFIELPGRTIPSLMADLCDEKIELLKIDTEGTEYELLPTLDLRAMGVKVFATELHHNGSVRDARRFIASLRERGYDPVACHGAVKLTFVRRDLIDGLPPT